MNLETVTEAGVEEYVRSLYNHLLHRPPAQEEVDQWMHQFSSTPDAGVIFSKFTESDEFRARTVERQKSGSPFFHYNSTFDATEVLYRHAVTKIKAHPKYLTNFLGVLVDPKFCRPHLDGSSGLVEAIPIPCNWHADIAEWSAALRAVDLASESFTVVELGCGWGCWMNNTGVAARRANLKVKLIGVEGHVEHIEFANESTAVNGFSPSQVVLHHGIASGSAGTALFLRAGHLGEGYGSMPIFGASETQRQDALRTGNYDVLPMLTLAEIVESEPRIDLLHIDIQGGEADFVAATMDTLNAKVTYVLIGTHSRQIEGRLFDTMLNAGWQLEIERPAILSISDVSPVVTVDGVQGWRNPSYKKRH